MSFGGSPSPPASPPPPPPPPNPGTPASAQQLAGLVTRSMASGAAAAGFDNTITNQGGAQGIANALVTGNGDAARKILTGQ